MSNSHFLQSLVIWGWGDGIFIVSKAKSANCEIITLNVGMCLIDLVP
jgi:hypothetical protein